MAFHQPTRQVPQRLIRPEPEQKDASQALAPQVRSGPDELQTWVLFSPATDVGTTTSYISSFRASQPTPGRSRISDDGSVVTNARSTRNSQPRNSAVPSELSYSGEAIEEDGELDSLDSHLPEFRAFVDPYSRSGQQPAAHSVPVLPAHDGLGSFRLETKGASGNDVQNQLYAFERYNPRRLKRRRESLELGQRQLEGGTAEEVDRMGRIESWRLEHSQFLLAEIQRETRRRRLSEASFQKIRAKIFEADDEATLGAIGEDDTDTPMASSEWHDQDESEGIWTRLTGRVMHDILGIDYRLFPFIFREAPPGLGEFPSMPKASIPGAEVGAPARQPTLESYGDSTWHLRMLERLSRELGLLVHQISTHHPGAFATYVRVQHEPLPYGGLPVIPETIADVSRPDEFDTKPGNSAAPTVPQFQPTIPPDLRPEVIEASANSAASCSKTNHIPATAYGAATFTQREWEQDLDIKLVFRYLRSRFSSSHSPSSSSTTSASPAFTAGTSHLAICSTQDVAAKAARVRQYHPLIARARQNERRPFKAGAAPPLPPPLLLRHASGSCASQSTRRSARRSSGSSRHSSRHYWDLAAAVAGPAGSIGTGSIVTSVGPMGSWGEI